MFNQINNKVCIVFSLIVVLRISDATFNNEESEFSLDPDNFIDNNLPCKFMQSIDITGEIVHPNGSIFFDYMEFPIGTYANVSYKIQSELIRPFPGCNYEEYHYKRIPTKAHLRGCVCNRKSCIRFCCKKSYQIFKNGKCIDDHYKNVQLPMLDKNGHFFSGNLKDHFYYVNRKPCSNLTINNHILFDEVIFI